MKDSNESQSLPSLTICCERSGLPLIRATAVCSLGWPALSSLPAMLHPVYGNSLGRNLAAFRAGLQATEDAEWDVSAGRQNELRLLASALMYSLGAMWLPPEGSVHKILPSLPAWSVLVGSGKRLADLCGWYHHATSKRMKFAVYRVTETAGNRNWENFKIWLDSAWEVKQEWEKGRAKVVRNEMKQELDREAKLLIRADRIYSRLDFTKVWNWIDAQIAADQKNYPVGRRETFKDLFLTGELHPEDWMVDDVEDLQYAMSELCDLGTEIHHFANARLNGIKASIKEFYSGFTIIGAVASDGGAEETELEKEKKTALFAPFEARAEQLEVLPPAPVATGFANRGLYLKALAQWNILKRVWEERQRRNRP